MPGPFWTIAQGQAFFVAEGGFGWAVKEMNIKGFKKKDSSSVLSALIDYLHELYYL